MRHFRIFLALLFILVARPAIANLDEVEGFFPVRDLFAAPASLALENSIFKIYLQEDISSPNAIHGTAFGIAENGLLLTNVHNMTQCLAKHGLLETGYDGSKGPLPCTGFVLVDKLGQKYSDISLLGSYSRADLHDHNQDFAAIRVEGLRNGVLSFRKTDSIDLHSRLFLVGYPGETRRNAKFLNSAKVQISESIRFTTEFAREIQSISNLTSEGLFLKYNEFFQKLYATLPEGSNFLAGAAAGFNFGLYEFNNYEPDLYQERLLLWAGFALKDFYVFSKIIERGLNRRNSDAPEFQYPDANNELKVSGMIPVELVFSNGHSNLRLKGDGRPGSSGSPVIDKDGFVYGILNLLEVGDMSGEIGCALDAVFSDFESAEYSFCERVSLRAVPSSNILKKLSDWQIHIGN